MSMIKSAGESLNVWKLAIFKAGLVAFLAGYTTLQTSLNGLEWGQISPTQRFILVAGIIASMATSIVAFLDRTISKIEGEQKQIDNQPPKP